MSIISKQVKKNTKSLNNKTNHVRFEKRTKRYYNKTSHHFISDGPERHLPGGVWLRRVWRQSVHPLLRVWLCCWVGIGGDLQSPPPLQSYNYQLSKALFRNIYFFSSKFSFKHNHWTTDFLIYRQSNLAAPYTSGRRCSKCPNFCRNGQCGESIVQDTIFLCLKVKVVSKW